MRTKRNSRNPRTRRAKRALRRLHDPPSQRTLKSLKNLSYRDLKALSSEQLQKYKRRLHIIDQEGNPYTDEELRKKLRPYISAGSKKGGGKSVYLIFQEGSSDKFWSATKDGPKITTKWGKIGTDGSSTTKDYGSKVDEEYEKLIQSKKKKGYVEAKESKTGSKTGSKSESKKTLRKELDCKKFTRYHKGKGNRLQWPPVMMGIPAGKGQAYKYLGKYNQFTDEPVPVKKGLVAKRVKNPDDDAWGQYCGDRKPASKADMPVHPGSQKYFIHDNGGRPFLVYVAGNNVWIYKHSKKTVVEDQKDFDNPKYYTELVKEYTAKQVFIGKSPKNEMTKYS